MTWCGRRELYYRRIEQHWTARGYSIELNEWVYGIPYRDTTGTYIIEFHPRCLKEGPPVFHKVYQNSIGQFTGLDCLGKDIYEGDIIRYNDRTWVVYRDFNYPNGFNIKSGKNKEHLSNTLPRGWLRGAEIIGNRFEKYLKRKEKLDEKKTCFGSNH